MGILQGKSSLPLGNNPKPRSSAKMLSAAQLLIPPYLPKSLSFPKTVQKARNLNTKEYRHAWYTSILEELNECPSVSLVSSTSYPFLG